MHNDCSTKKNVFYHYTRFSNQIKKDGKLLASSYPKTSIYDLILDFCPHTLLPKKEIKRLKKYRLKHISEIAKIRKEHKIWKHYLSAYNKLRLNYTNRVLTEFFRNKWYVSAFSELFEKGWISTPVVKHDVHSLFIKIGNKYIKFNITKHQFNNSFVFEQSYWRIMNRKYSKRLWNNYLKEDRLFYENFNELDEKSKQFARYFAKKSFSKYYNSVKRLKDYRKGDFKQPEYWIYGNVPINRCKFGEVPYKLFETKTGLSKNDLDKRGIRKYDHSTRKSL